MGRFCRCSAAFLVLCSTMLFAAPPVETHGRLQVSGTKLIGLCDSQVVQIAGMSLYWSIWGGENYYKRETVDWLVTDWHINLIRAAMGVEGGYLSDASRQTSLVKTIIDAAISNGIYVIIDWHDHNANKNVEQAKIFFGEMSKQYAGIPNIIWEIWNEPDLQNGSGPEGADTWADIKEYAEAVIPVIRKNSDNLIVVGTPLWSQDVHIASRDPIVDPNVAYALHFYTCSHADSLRWKADTALDNGVALFITEFGLTTYDGGNRGSGNYRICTDSSDFWLDWADERKISWANWSLHNIDEASAALLTPEIDKWEDSQLSESGKWIRNRLLERPAYDHGEKLPFTLPGRIEAESYSKKAETLKTETTGDSAGGGENFCYTTSGCWAEYDVVIEGGGTFSAQARVATEFEGGAITLKVNDTVKTVFNVPTTGGWQNYRTVTAMSEFELPPSGFTLRLEWNGTASSLVNLNWIDLVPVAVAVKTKENGCVAHSIKISRCAGTAAIDAGADALSVSLLSLSGRVIKNISAEAGRVRLPSYCGMGLLLVKYRSGAVEMVKIAAW